MDHLIHAIRGVGRLGVVDRHRQRFLTKPSAYSVEVIPGFDEAVRGMSVGETKTVEIEPEDAYGPRREGLVATIERERAQFPVEPQVGMNLALPLQDGNQLEVVVTEVTPEHVTIDGNHPLAGEKLIFDVELVGNEAKD